MSSICQSERFPLICRIGVGFLLLLVGCEAGQSRNRIPANTDLDPAKILLSSPDSAPFLTVHSVDTLGSEAGFHRVVDGVRLDNGVTIIADGGEQHLAIFDEDGKLADTFGGLGDGPSEFRRISNVWRLPDGSIGAFDRRESRVSVMGSEGENSETDLRLLRQFRLAKPSDGLITSVIGSLSDGDIVAWTQRSDRKPVERIGARELRCVVFMANAGNDSAAVLGDFVGRTVWLGDLPRSPTGLAVYGPAPFSLRSDFLLVGSRIIVVRSDTFGFTEYGKDGRPVRHWRMQHEPRHLAPEDRKRHLDQWIREYPREESWPLRRRAFSSVEYPRELPAIISAATDGSSYVWIEPGNQWNGVTRELVRYDLSGSASGRLTLPYAVRVLDMGREWILTLETDRFGAEIVILRWFGQTADVAHR